MGRTLARCPGITISSANLAIPDEFRAIQGYSTLFNAIQRHSARISALPLSRFPLCLPSLSSNLFFRVIQPCSTLNNLKQPCAGLRTSHVTPALGFGAEGSLVLGDWYLEHQRNKKNHGAVAHSFARENHPAGNSF